MDDLIKSWEKLADKYNGMADRMMDSYTVERLYAQADTLKLCADQLKRVLNDTIKSDTA